MATMNQALLKLVEKGTIDPEMALKNSSRPEELEKLFQGVVPEPNELQEIQAARNNDALWQAEIKSQTGAHKAVSGGHAGRGQGEGSAPQPREPREPGQSPKW